jgi:hypothetical protein
MDREETQYGWIMIAVCFGVFIFMLLTYVNRWGNRPIPKTGFLIMTGVFFVLLSVFYKLTIRLEGRSITVLFGIGLIRKRITPEKILRVEPFKVPWYYGSGVRMTAKGMLYSLQGSRAVRIVYLERGKEKSVLIGTSDPEQLKMYLERHFY